MQPQFEASQNEDLIENVKLAILKAIQKNQPIVFLEYDNCGKSDSRLTSLARRLQERPFPHEIPWWRIKWNQDGRPVAFQGKSMRG